MDNDLISRKEARELLYKRLYETALNNVGVCMDGIEEVYQDIADKRLDTWISEIPPADEIKVGDEVTDNDGWQGVVTRISPDGEYLVIIQKDGAGLHWKKESFKKTGRHFPQIEEVLKQMQEDE